MGFLPESTLREGQKSERLPWRCGTDPFTDNKAQKQPNEHHHISGVKYSSGAFLRVGVSSPVAIISTREIAEVATSLPAVLIE